MSSTGQNPVRRFPPPCWTRDEALILIDAYRERWHALHRAFLRTPDWDTVAEKVTTACPDVTPPKTAAQCRHKMEKLRQRHRVEKQRAAEFSGERFLSAWLYYEPMEAMENGSGTEPGESGIRVKPVREFVTSAPISTKHRTKVNPNSTNFGSRVSNRYNSFLNNRSNQDQDVDYEDQLLVEAPIEETLIPRATVRDSKRHKNTSIGVGIGIRIKPSINTQEQSGRQGLRPRKFSKVVNDEEDDGQMWVKIPRSVKLPKSKWGNDQNERNSNRNDRKGTNLKRGIEDVVASIRVLGEGFMKVEMMKMEIVREIEEMRIENEMKWNRLMLESQKQIVDAFVNGLIECSRKMQQTTMADV